MRVMGGRQQAQRRQAPSCAGASKLSGEPGRAPWFSTAMSTDTLDVHATPPSPKTHSPTLAGPNDTSSTPRPVVCRVSRRAARQGPTTRTISLAGLLPPPVYVRRRRRTPSPISNLFSGLHTPRVAPCVQHACRTALALSRLVQLLPSASWRRFPYSQPLWRLAALRGTDMSRRTQRSALTATADVIPTSSPQRVTRQPRRARPSTHDHRARTGGALAGQRGRPPGLARLSASPR